MSSSPAKEGPNEDALRRQLEEALRELKRREPLDTTYKSLLMNGIVTSRKPVLPKDKSYKRIGSDLRFHVEAFIEQTQGKDPLDRITQRQPLQEDQMRAALTLRDAKKHEQKALLEATLSNLPKRAGMDASTRRRYLEGICLGLREATGVAVVRNANNNNRSARNTPVPHHHAAAEQAELERQRAQARESARMREVEVERRRQEVDNSKRKKRVETPQGALHKLIHPIFKILWDMEFEHLHGINPFRMVIDRENCASCGAPDYFDVIQKPMNLTYIKHKVENLEYMSLQQFCQDVELMVSNALLYNSDPSNPYHTAAKELQKHFRKAAKRVLAKVKEARK